MAVQVFAVSVFFVCFRECIETSIIVSVLLAFLKQTLQGDENSEVYKQLKKQVWTGVAAGLIIVVIIGGGMIGAFYGLQQNVFADSEDLWEGIFGIIATLIISAMGAALLRVNKLQDKWKVKLRKALETKDKGAPSHTRVSGRMKRAAEKYAMFVLPFVTVLREGLEAVIFIGGVGLGLPASSFPLAVFCGLLAGCLVGYVVYRGGRGPSLQIFLIVSTCFLYLVAAGLFSKAVWFFENYLWSRAIGGDASETGSGPGSYDIRQSVWHVDCCSPVLNGGGGWGIFNAVLGWQNSATYGSILSYNLYWLAIIITFLYMRHQEKRSSRTAIIRSDVEPDQHEGRTRIMEAPFHKEPHIRGAK